MIGASLSEPHIDEFAVNFLYIYIRERGSVLYLGMVTEILNLPYFCITQIMAKEATNPKPSMQRE